MATEHLIRPRRGLDRRARREPARRADPARRRRLRRGPRDLERRARPPSRADRPLRRRGRRRSARVEFARSEELVVAVRGGGHSIPGFSTVDGGIVIDLSPMKGVQRRSRGAASSRAEAGVTWARASTTRRRRSGSPSPAASCPHRHRRLHARRRHRLADAQARPGRRQPDRRPTSSPPTAGSCTPARTRTRSSSGACAAAAATSASSRRSSTSCTRSARSSSAARLLPGRHGRRRPALLPRLGSDRARRADDAREPRHRAAGAVPPRGVARQAHRAVAGMYAGLDRRRPSARARRCARSPSRSRT